MGISGLLKTLESISNTKHLSEYKGMKVAVDGYCWLHKAIYLISHEIFENPKSTKFMTYLIRRINSLVSHGIIPVIVFDGDKLPMKKGEEEERANKRKENRRIAKELYDKGQKDAARQKMVESVDINPQMAYTFIKELKRRKIEYFVAPYEADAQLAYLAKINYVDMVITEDSDLLALGCPRVLFKLDIDTNYGVEINLSDLPRCKAADFTLFHKDKFLYYCILSGCDYFKLKGVGTKTAYQAVKERNHYRDSLKLLRLNDKNFNFPVDMEETFEKALLTFKFQVVYCPLEKKMRHFSDSEDGDYRELLSKFEDLSFLGEIYGEQETKNIVFAVIDPISRMKFEETKSDAVNRLFGANIAQKPLHSKAGLKVSVAKEDKEENVDVNESKEDNEDSDTEEKIFKPDSIQQIAIKMSQPKNTQSHSTNLKRKNPYSQNDHSFKIKYNLSKNKPHQTNAFSQPLTLIKQSIKGINTPLASIEEEKSELGRSKEETLITDNFSFNAFINSSTLLLPNFSQGNRSDYSNSTKYPDSSTKASSSKENSNNNISVSSQIFLEAYKFDQKELINSDLKFFTNNRKSGIVEKNTKKFKFS